MPEGERQTKRQAHHKFNHLFESNHFHVFSDRKLVETHPSGQGHPRKTPYHQTAVYDGGLLKRHKEV